MGNMVQLGVVCDFDPSVGLGTVRTDAGVEHPFHCTEIADGSRAIEAGARVTFLVYSKLGIDEATGLTTITTAVGDA